MSRQPSPRELYPNLFGEKPAKAAPRRPEEMRLLRWNVRQAAAARPMKAEARRAAPRPLAPRTAQR